ncbi:Embryo-specific protein 3B [Hibiscus trionum]|uniref:Embryo-specific protein 3B n=1 Tax=Hibiscus trionum TaxID=183268 RepID=A0A9W7IPD1_HIBTR|nr:Embryo-specific protein 3B [Hibiscus trionum]
MCWVFHFPSFLSTFLLLLLLQKKGISFSMKPSKAAIVLLYFGFVFILCEAKRLREKPQAFESFNVSYIQNLGSCSYSVVFTTSCSSTAYTRDQISIAFGDAYGNQIYAPRLDNPSSRAFERCSSDTFEIKGPCAYQICYVYLYRTGPDGWKPETVKIYAYNSKAVTFYYNTFIPGDVWYGFNYCNRASSSHRLISRMSLLLVILWFVFYALT